MADEPRIVSLGAYGDVDFFSFKGVVETLLGVMRIENPRFEAETANPSYHPGRCARVYAGDTLIGVFGQVHPLVAGRYGVDCDLYTAELMFEALLECQGAEPVYVPLPRFPSITRDIAVVCDCTVTVAQLSDAIYSSGGQYLKKCELFDVYTGTGIPQGKKSVAFSLTMRAEDQTLTDEHAGECVSAILAALEKNCGAVIR